MKKRYTGQILEDQDPKGQGRYLVYVPDILIGTGHTGIWCVNAVAGSKYIRYKDETSGTIKSAGNYQPLKRGMQVEVEITDGLYGKIVNILDNSLIPPPHLDNRDGFTLLFKTEDESWGYYDEGRKLFHVMLSSGKVNIMADDKSIYMNVGHIINGGLDGLEPKTGTILKIQDNGITISQNESFIRMEDDIIELRANTKSFIRLTKDGIELYGDNIKINGEEQINVLSKKHMRLGSARHTHIAGTELRITGYQTLLLNSAYVKAEAACLWHNISRNVIYETKDLYKHTADLTHFEYKETKWDGNFLLKGDDIKFFGDPEVSGQITASDFNVSDTVYIRVAKKDLSLMLTIKRKLKMIFGKLKELLKDALDSIKKAIEKTEEWEKNSAEMAHEIRNTKSIMPYNDYIPLSTNISMVRKEDEMRNKMLGYEI